MAILQRSVLPLPRVGLPRATHGRWLLAGATAVLVAAALLQVNQFSRLTSTSYQINDLNAQRAARQAANHDLEAEVARLSSLARVEIEARLRLGLGPAERTLYVDVNQPAPDRQTLPTRFLPPDRPPAARGSGGWLSFIRKLLPF